MTEVILRRPVSAHKRGKKKKKKKKKKENAQVSEKSQLPVPPHAGGKKSGKDTDRRQGAKGHRSDHLLHGLQASAGTLNRHIHIDAVVNGNTCNHGAQPGNKGRNIPEDQKGKIGGDDNGHGRNEKNQAGAKIAERNTEHQ